MVDVSQLILHALHLTVSCETWHRSQTVFSLVNMITSHLMLKVMVSVCLAANAAVAPLQTVDADALLALSTRVTS